MITFFTVEGAFAYFTECNLATLEKLQTLTRSSKTERQRQKNICDEMVGVCRDFGIQPDRTNLRLSKALAQQREHGACEVKQRYINWPVFWVGQLWGLIETAHYGWNLTAASDAEMICDGIAFLILALAFVLPPRAHAVGVSDGR